VLSNENEQPEFVDQSCWVPQGEEVIPAMLFINRHVIAEGNRFISTNYGIIDRLLQTGKIEQQHHAIAMKLIKFYKLGTAKQDYAVMKMFMLPNGFDSSNFCPLSVFIRVTRPLKGSLMRWIKAIVGIEEQYSFDVIAANSMQVKDALETVSEHLAKYEEEQARAAAQNWTPTEIHAWR